MNYWENGLKLFIAAMLIVMAGCGSTGNASYPEGSLEAQLNEISGVRVSGSGDYAKVVIQDRKLSRARKSQTGFNGEAESGYRDSYKKPPLFIVDNQNIGRDFKEVKNIVADKEIKSVKLLSHNIAAQYGREESQFGVIEITTK